MKVDALPFQITESALVTMSDIIGRAPDGIDSGDAKVYRDCHAVLFPRLLIGGLADERLERTHSLPITRELSPAEGQFFDNLSGAVRTTLRKLRALLPFEMIEQE